jgi:hypothetical protein
MQGVEIIPRVSEKKPRAANFGRDSVTVPHSASPLPRVIVYYTSFFASTWSALLCCATVKLSGTIFRIYRNNVPIIKRRLGENGPGEALARWTQRYAAFLGTKRGLSWNQTRPGRRLALGKPQLSTPLPVYFQARLEPALRMLLESAAADGEVRTDFAAEHLLDAVASLCMRAYD